MRIHPEHRVERAVASRTTRLALFVIIGGCAHANPCGQSLVAECTADADPRTLGPVMVAQHPSEATSLRVRAVNRSGDSLYVLEAVATPADVPGAPSVELAPKAATALPPGRYHVRLRALGYQRRDTTIQLPAAVVTELTFPLAVSVNRLGNAGVF